MVRLLNKPAPNTACTWRVGFCGIFRHFSGFEFFLLSNRIHARPHAANANRWAHSSKKRREIWTHNRLTPMSSLRIMKLPKSVRGCTERLVGTKSWYEEKCWQLDHSGNHPPHRRWWWYVEIIYQTSDWKSHRRIFLRLVLASTPRRVGQKLEL